VVQPAYHRSVRIRRILWQVHLHKVEDRGTAFEPCLLAPRFEGLLSSVCVCGLKREKHPLSGYGVRAVGDTIRVDHAGESVHAAGWILILRSPGQGRASS
jgi:hypothetical protein